MCGGEESLTERTPFGRQPCIVSRALLDGFYRASRATLVDQHHYDNNDRLTQILGLEKEKCLLSAALINLRKMRIFGRRDPGILGYLPCKERYLSCSG